MISTAVHNTYLRIGSWLVLMLFVVPLYGQAADLSLTDRYQAAVLVFQSAHQSLVEKQAELPIARKLYMQASATKNQATRALSVVSNRLNRAQENLRGINARLKNLQKKPELKITLDLSAKRTAMINSIAELQQQYLEYAKKVADANESYQQTRTTYMTLQRELNKLERDEQLQRTRMISYQRRLKIEKSRERIAAQNTSSFKGSAPTTTTSTNTEQLKIPLELGSIKSEQKILQDFSRDDFSTTASFDWPIEPIKGISAYFHDENYVKVFGTDHYAIDIVADQGTEVVAPADGYVLRAEESETGFSYVVILHDSGYLTFYGHLSQINVEVGDLVRRDSFLGLSGGKPGTSGAGSKTTGPHLHFEVWRDGYRVDPMLYLPKVK